MLIPAVTLDIVTWGLIEPHFKLHRLKSTVLHSSVLHTRTHNTNGHFSMIVIDCR